MFIMTFLPIYSIVPILVVELIPNNNLGEYIILKTESDIHYVHIYYRYYK